MTITRRIPLAMATRIANALTLRIGMPETSSGSFLGVWCSEAAWRYRRDDGSSWARLGCGRTRKMITLAWTDRDTETALLHVHHCGQSA